MNRRFDFDEEIDRRLVPALKVHRMVLGDGGEDLFAAGVADMDPEQMFEEVGRFVKDGLLPEMRAVWPNADIRFTPLSVVSTLNTDEDHEIARGEAFVLRLAEQFSLG